MGKIYITSDAHFGHYNEIEKRGIITFERNNFSSIQEHDDYLEKLWISGSNKVKEDDDFGFLGDFGNLKYLGLFQLFSEEGCRTHFLLGNHDSAADIPEIQNYVDFVYQYPVYLSNKLVLSHEPVGVGDSVLNVHGHLHSSIINKPNYLNASIHVANYKPITDKNIATAFAKLPKGNMRFLYEPYAANYKFTQPKEDVIMNKDGLIDLSASRTLQRLNNKKRKNENNPYQPYDGRL